MENEHSNNCYQNKDTVTVNILKETDLNIGSCRLESSEHRSGYFMKDARSVIRHPLSSHESSSVSLESLELDVQNADSIPQEICHNPVSMSQRDSGATCLSDNDEDDPSIFQAVLSPDCQDVRLKRDGKISEVSKPMRKITIPSEYLSDDSDDFSLNGDMEATEKLEQEDPSVRQRLIRCSDATSQDSISLNGEVGETQSQVSVPEPIPEYTAEEEREDRGSWKKVSVGGSEKTIDMKVIEPYKRVLSHGGYLNTGSHNAIVVFSACYLPHNSRVDYNYVMDNLFYYVVSTLDELVIDDYVLVYLLGGTSKNCMPNFAWLKKSYQMIDRRLRKNLKRLYIVHPTFWIKTLIMLTKPFISAKFSRKITYVSSLSELLEMLPLEQASLPEQVRQYDRNKLSVEQNHV